MAMAEGVGFEERAVTATASQSRFTKALCWP